MGQSCYYKQAPLMALEKASIQYGVGPLASWIKADQDCVLGVA